MTIDELIESVLEDFTEAERRELLADRGELERIVAELLEEHRECVTAPECPTYCGDETGRLERIGKLEAWVGLPTEIIYPVGGMEGGKSGLGELRAVYALVDKSKVIPSHDPITFRESKSYPRDLQERAYDKDKLEQQKVIRQAETLIPDLLINSNPDAVNGPPVIDTNGHVLGGNSRTMSILRVLADGPDNRYTRALTDELEDHGGVFGLAGTPTTNMVFVRVVTGEYDPVRVSRDLNRSLTQGLSLAAQAVSLGRMLPPRLFWVIGESMFKDAGDKSLNVALNRNSKEILRILQAAQVVTQQNYSKFAIVRKGQPTTDLSSTGRQLIRDAIVGAFVSDKEWMTLLSPAQERLYEYLAPGAMVLDTDDPTNAKGFNLTASFRPAVALLTNRPTTRMDVFEAQFTTGELGFGAESEAATMQQRYPEFFADPLAAILSRWLIQAIQTPRVALKALAAYINGTPERAQQAMFALEETPEQLRVRTLGADFTAGRVTISQVESVGVMSLLKGSR